MKGSNMVSINNDDDLWQNLPVCNLIERLPEKKNDGTAI